MVLALLVSELGRPCRADRLIEALWGDDPPANARRLVQGLVSRLRGLLDPPESAGTTLRSVPGGWQLDLDPDTVDVARFERLSHAARNFARDERATARHKLEEAINLWQGPPYGELGDEPALAADTRRLAEELLGARELLLHLHLQAGEHAKIVAELEQLAAQHPFRERLWGLLMEALYRSGRQADALAAYQSLRERLVDELGTEPGPELQGLHTAVLRQEVSAAETREGPSGPAAPSWPCRRNLPLVGRAGELEALQEVLERARGGRLQVVLVSGEPGIGKTRLVAEAADAARHEGADVLVGRCPDGAAAPYQPFVEALRADTRITPDEHLEVRLGPHAGELARLLPELGDRAARAPASSSVSPELDQHRLFDAVAGWLEAASSQAPLVVVLEDLHNATGPTLLLLRHVIRAAPTSRVLLIATYRDAADEQTTELADTLAWLERHPDVTHLELTPLRRSDVIELVATLDPPAHSHHRLAQALHAKTAGNALFVQELLASLRSPSTTDPARLEEIGVPRSLQHLLEARIRRLGATTIRFLEHAAVAGETFRFGPVAEAARISEDDALDALDEAISARLAATTDPYGERYAFSHAIMRDALLARITPSRRLRLHARVAEALERRHAGELDAVADELAYHYAEAGPAGDRGKALSYAEAAGRVAMAQLDYEQAAVHYRRALQLLDPVRAPGHPGREAAADTPDRDARTGLERRGRLWLDLGRARGAAGDSSEGRAAAERAAADARSIGNGELLAQAALGVSSGVAFGVVDHESVGLLEEALEQLGTRDDALRSRLLARLASELYWSEDRDRRHRISDEALEVARRVGDPSVLADVLDFRHWALWEPDNLEDRIATADAIVEVADAQNERLFALRGRMWRVADLMERGDMEAAEDEMRTFTLLAEELRHVPSRWYAALWRAMRELLSGRFHDAEVLAAEALETLQVGGNEPDDIAVQNYWGQVAAIRWEQGRLGELADAVDEFVAASPLPIWGCARPLVLLEAGREVEARRYLALLTADRFRALPRDATWMASLAILSEVAARLGETEAAAALHELLSPYADRCVVIGLGAVCLGSVSHYLGLLAAALERYEEAELHFAAALRTHRRLGSPPLLAHTRRRLAEMLIARDAPGEGSRARELLAEAADGYRELGMTAHAARCDGTLAPGTLTSDPGVTTAKGAGTSRP